MNSAAPSAKAKSPGLHTIHGTFGYWSGLFCDPDWAQDALKRRFIRAVRCFCAFAMSRMTFLQIADFMFYTLYMGL